MVILGFMAYAIQPKLHVGVRVIIVALACVAFAEIISSNSIQGLAVTGFGLALVTIYKLRSLNYKSRLTEFSTIGSYLLLVFIGGITALLGALQKGPLAEYIYKPSVSLRGEYWLAGINMALEKPLTGVGMDSYGDWYRRSRDAQALIVPGPNTVTNAAHNVPIDFLAYGGFPLFFAYLGFILVGLIALIKVVRRQKSYDWVFVSISGIWLAYHLQSVISINQIGLAIWGWSFGGALIAFEISTRPKKDSDSSESSRSKTAQGRSIKNKQSETIFSSTLLAGIGAVVGLLIAAPPYSADAKWRSALASQNVQKVEEALVPGFLNPQNSYKYVNAVQLLESSKLYDLAYKYASIAVDFNPNNFDSWKVLYFITNSTAEDKARALENMKRLDPNNPNVLG
jgi:hypothetical protein